ncbi:MAG: transcriptional regulator [Sporolactobacillus laevolacticus]|jgi:transcriptional regulator of the spore photoproduct lyase operon|nr:transcriptional regulator [Sporolactobacillus laevolacticus]
MKKDEMHLGDHVYVICRNPHTASVAMIQEAEVVDSPDKTGNKVLFLHELHYEFADEDAIFPTFDEAQRVYRQIYDED